MRSFGHMALFLALVGCEWNSKSPADAPTTRIDSRTQIDAGLPTGHILLTEVALEPAAGEFVEILNPTTNTVALDEYFFSDHGHYFALPTGLANIDSSDFIVQFPPGSSIAPNEVITVSIGSAAQFMTTYAMAPTFSVPTMIQTQVQGSPS